MSHRDNNKDIDDEIFDILFTDVQTNNQRIAVRYIRTDISASVFTPGFLNFSKKHTAVELLDISSKGAAIECEKKLRIKKRIILELIFTDNHKFVIRAKIIHQAINKKQYGLKFDRFNHDLGDYLLSSQNDLIFK